MSEAAQQSLSEGKTEGKNWWQIVPGVLLLLFGLSNGWDTPIDVRNFVCASVLGILLVGNGWRLWPGKRLNWWGVVIGLLLLGSGLAYGSHIDGAVIFLDAVGTALFCLGVYPLAKSA